MAQAPKGQDKKGRFFWTRQQVRKLEEAHAADLAQRDQALHALNDRVLRNFELLDGIAATINEYLAPFRTKTEPATETPAPAEPVAAEAIAE